MQFTRDSVTNSRANRRHAGIVCGTVWIAILLTVAATAASEPTIAQLIGDLQGSDGRARGQLHRAEGGFWITDLQRPGDKDLSVTGEQTSADGRLVIMTGPSTKPVTVTNADGQRLKNVHWDEAARRLTVRLAEAGVHTVVIER